MNSFGAFPCDKLGKISHRHIGNELHFRKYPNVKWVVKEYGSSNEKWISEVANDGYEIKQYALSTRDISQFKQDIETQAASKAQKRAFLSEINKPLTNVNSVDFLKSEVIGVFQHSYGITTGNRKRPILATLGEGSCVILALYDKAKKVAGLALIDDIAEVESIDSIIKDMNVESTVAHLYGGDVKSYEQCLDIVDFIRKRNIKIENCALVEHSSGSVSLGIDARNGKIYSPVSYNQMTLIQMTLLEDFDIKMRLCPLAWGSQLFRVGY